MKPEVGATFKEATCFWWEISGCVILSHHRGNRLHHKKATADQQKLVTCRHVITFMSPVGSGFMYNYISSFSWRQSATPPVEGGYFGCLL